MIGPQNRRINDAFKALAFNSPSTPMKSQNRAPDLQQINSLSI